jgi:ribonuclease HI
VIEIYTDGSCPNQGKDNGIGGWAAILKLTTPDGEHIKEISGNKPYSTNNEMELMAAYEALKALNDTALKHTIIVVSDSQYVVNSFRAGGGWAYKWAKYGWSKMPGVQIPIKNIHLIKPIHELSKKFNVVWKWVRGHNGNELNERADVLANEARRRLVYEIRGGS